MGKLKSIVVDTLTAIQVNEYMRDKKKANHDKWKDYGQDIYSFILDLQELGFDCVAILGPPGTGKSSGMRTLEPQTNIWFNTDNKNPVWSGGRAEYGKKSNPKEPFHYIPGSYDEIISVLKGIKESGGLSDDPVAFLTAHTETYREDGEVRSRLKTLGNMATNMQLEGKLETVLYSKVLSTGNEKHYILETQNSGLNTARSPQGMFEDIIPNDYNLVLESIINY